MIDTEAIKNIILESAFKGKIIKETGIHEDIDDLISSLPQPSDKRNKFLKHGGRQEDFSYVLPPNWTVVPLGKITSYGDSPQKIMVSDVDLNMWILELEDIETGGRLLKKVRANERKSIGEKIHFKCGQILYSKLRPYLKKVIQADEDGICTPELIAFDVFSKINPRYVMYYLKCNSVDKIINQRAYGVKMPRVDVGFMINLPVPLPVVSVQNKIVEFLDNAFALLEIIDDFQIQYSFNLKILKSKIITAGIQGKLTEQLPDDGTAEELLEQIAKEKEQLIKDKKIKASKPLPKIQEDEIPFEIPQNWKWVRWGELSQSIQYGYSAPAKSEGRIKMVRISDIQDNIVFWDTVPYCDIEEDLIEEYLLKQNDILFARTGGTVGKSYIVSDISQEAIYAGYLIRTRYSNMLCAKFLKFFMESDLYWKQLKNGTIATAQPNCNGKTLSKMMVPLPSFAEQERIVKKIDELLVYL